MKSLIIDDEPLARRELRRLLAEFPGSRSWARRAMSLKQRRVSTALAPDLLFLDIQMPGGSGFDLLARLDHVPRVIFTTAYDHHAVRAFEVNALDYLLKPIEPQRAGGGAHQGAIDAGGTKCRSPGATTSSSGCCVRDGDRCWFVPLREVSMLLAEGNYVRLFWGPGASVARPALAQPGATARSEAVFAPIVSRSSMSTSSKTWTWASAGS